MTDLPSSRDLARLRLVEVAAELLASGGPDAVTTRSVAQAAGVQAPMIYRHFGDKDGLLAAVVEYGFSSYLDRKPPVDAEDDPVAGLRAGWDLHVGFGLENPALFRLMHTGNRTTGGQAAADAGGDVLLERLRRVARAGRLRVSERRAVELIRAAGTGVVFVLIDQASPDLTLADLAWEAVCAVVLADERTAPAGPAAAAVSLRAGLPDLDFRPAERGLLDDWLGRIAES